MFFPAVALSHCFIGHTYSNTIGNYKSYPLQAVVGGDGDLDDLRQNDNTQNLPTDDVLLQQLQQKTKELENGVGKRYIVRTTQGFLNVHSEPGDPFELDNVVGQLSEGEIVTSVKPNVGDWVCHDSGGWSISLFNDFVWLQPIDF